MKKRLGSTNILLYIILIVGFLMSSIFVVDAANKKTELRDIDFLPGSSNGVALRASQAEIDMYSLEKEMCANGDTVILKIGIKNVFDITNGPFTGPGVVNDSLFVPGLLSPALYGDTITIVYHYSDGINTFSQDVIVLGPPVVEIEGDYIKPTGICNSIALRGNITSGASTVTKYAWTQQNDLYGVPFPTGNIEYIGDAASLVTSYTYTGTSDDSQVYYLMVEDSKGCRDTVSTRVNAYGISADAGVPVMEVGTCTGVQLSGALSKGYKLAYQWSSKPANMLATSSLIEEPTTKILPSNTVFELLVTDDFGCKAIDSISLVAVQLKADAGRDEIITICEDIILDGSASYGQNMNTRWVQESGPSVVISNSANIKQNIPNNGPGVYRFKLYLDDSFLCQDSDVVIVEVRETSLDLLADKDTIGSCESVNLYADTNPGAIVTWSPSQKLSAAQGNIVLFTPTPADFGKTIVFTATIEDPICPTSKTYSIYVNPEPSAIIEASKPSYSKCQTGILSGATSTGAAPLSYTWSPLSDLTIRINRPERATFEPTTDKNFSLIVTDKFGCTSSTTKAVAVIEVNAGADISTPFCADVQLKGTKDAGIVKTYWSGSDNFSDTLNVLNPTLFAKEWDDFPVGQQQYTKTFYFFGLTADNCLISDSVKVTATKEDLSFSPSNATISTCGGVIPGTLNNSIEWLTTDYFSNPIIGKTSMTPSLLPPANVAGTSKMYYMLLTDQQSCPQQDSVQVNFIQGVVPTVVTPTILYAYPDVPFQVTGVSVSGGSGNYNYNWQPAKIFADYDVLSPIIKNPKAGITYSLDLTVSDMATNCVAYARFDVVVSDQFMITSLTSSDDTLCVGGSTTLNLEVFGGNKDNYSYEWTKVGTSGVLSTIQDPVVTITEATTFKVVATDGTSVDEATITLTVSDVSANAGDDQYIGSCRTAVLDGSASQGRNLSFAWESIPGLIGDVNSPSIIYDGSGANVKLTVTDVRGCTSTDEVEVTVADAPVAILPSRIVSPGCERILVDGSASTGESLSYLWSVDGSVSLQTVSQLLYQPINGGEQIVSVIVADRFGCSDIATSSVLADYFSVDLGPDATIFMGDTEPMEVSLTNTDPTSTYNVSWTSANYLQFGDVMQNITKPMAASRTFFATVTDASGCRARDAKRVNVIGGPLEVIIDGYSTAVCPGSTVSLSSLVSGGDGSYTYVWSDENNNVLGTNPTVDFSSVVDQTITLTVADGANEVASKSIFVQRTKNVIIPEVNFTGGGTYLIGKTPPSLILEKAQLGVTYELWQGVTLVETIIGTDLAYTWVAPADGVYRLMAYGNGPCDIAQSSSLTVRGIQLSPLEISSLIASENAVCAGEAVTLNLDFTGGDSSNYSVTWKDAADNIISTVEDPTFNVDATSTFFVTVADGISTVTSSISIEAWSVDANLGDDIAIGSCQTATLDASQSLGDGLTYQWTPVSGLVVQNTSSSASYSGLGADIEVIVTDSHNCIDRDTVTVTVGRLQAVLATDSISYSGCSSVELDGTGSKGEQLLYSWSTPSGSVVPANLAKTTFTPSNGGETKVLFSVTDKYGCTDKATAKVYADFLTVDLGDDVVIPYGSTTTFNPVLSPLPLSVPVKIAWTPDSLLKDDTILYAETKNLIADQTFVINVETGGCTASDDINVTLINTPYSVSIIGGDEPVCAGDQLTLAAKINSGLGIYLYKWTDGANTVLGTDSTLTYLPLLPSEKITLEVTNVAAQWTDPIATASKTITVNTNRIADITLSGGGSYKLGDALPSITLDNTEVGVSYDLVRNGVILETISGTGSSYTWASLGYGDYIVHASKVGACNAPISNFVTITLLADQLKITSLTASQDTACLGSSVVLNLEVEGGFPADYTYEWSTVDGLFARVQDPTIIADATKTYSVVVTDGVTTLTSSIQIIAASVTAVLGDDIVMGSCQTASLDASNSIGDGLSYNWSPLAGLVVSRTDYIASYKGDDATIEVTVTDKHGCSDTDQLNVTVEKVKAVVNTIPTLRCGIVALDASKSEGKIVSYSWSTLSGIVNPSNFSQAAFIPSNGGTNELILALEDTYGCITLDTTTIVSDYLTVNAGADEFIDAGTSVGLNGSASGQSSNLVYNWTPTASVVDPTSSVTTSNPLNTTTKFTLTVVDQDLGCTASDDRWAFVKGGNLSVTIDGNNGAVCGGDYIYLDAIPTGGAGNYTYRWETEQGMLMATTQYLYFQPMGDVNLVLKVTDGDSNSAQATTSIKVEFGLLGSVVLSGGGTYTDPNNIPPLRIDNPEIGYLYALTNNGAPIDTITSTGAPIVWDSPADGNYVVYASKIGVCGYLISNMVTVSRKPFDDLVITSLVASSDTACAGSIVTLDLEVNGGDASNYSYEWSTPSGVISTDQNAVVKVTRTRTYTVVVSDGISSISTSITVFVPNTNADLGPDLSIGSCQTALLDASASEGVDLVYQWTPIAGLTTSNTDYIASYAGDDATITVTVTDKYGCTSSDNIDIHVVNAPKVVLSDTVKTSSCSSVVLDATSSEGEALTYSWLPLGGSVSVTDLAKTTFTPSNGGSTKVLLAVEDMYGCKAAGSTIVTADYFTVDAGADEVIDSLGSASLVATISGQGTNFSYSWSPDTLVLDAVASSTTSIPLSSSKVFEVTVTDIDSNCKASDSKTVNVKGGPLTVLIVSNNPFICTGTSVTLTALASGGVPQYHYSWLDSKGVALGTSSTLTLNLNETSTITVHVYDSSSNRLVSDVITINVSNADVAIQTLSGEGFYIDPANKKPIILENSEVGVNYELIKDGIPVDTVIGNGLPIEWAQPADGAYRAVGFKTGGCRVEMTGVVVVQPSFFTNVKIDTIIVDKTTVCAGESLDILSVINGGNTANYSYKWSSSEGYFSSLQNPTIKVNTTTTYYFEATDGLTVDKDTITITVASVSANAGDDIYVGSCGTATLDASASMGNSLTFAWEDVVGIIGNLTDTVIQYKGISENIELIVTDKYGCIASDVVDVYFANSPKAMVSDTIKSVGCGVVALDGSASSGNGLTYSWLPLQGSISSPLLSKTNFTPVNGGANEVVLTVTDSYGCSNSKSVTVMADYMTVDAGVDEYLASGASASLTGVVTGAGTKTYSWLPVDKVQTPTDLVTSSLALSETTIFDLSVTNTDNGCLATDSKWAYVTGGALRVSISGYASPICAGDAVVLNSIINGGDGNYTIRWTDSNNEVLGTSNTLVVNPVVTSDISVKVTDGSGLISNDKVTIEIRDAGIALMNLSGGGTYCTATDIPSIQLDSTVVDVNYVLLNKGVPVDTIVGTGDVYVWTTPTDGDYTVFAYKAGSCNVAMMGAVSVANIILGDLDVDIQTTNDGNYCLGSSAGQEIWIDSSKENVKYELLYNNTLVRAIVGGGGKITWIVNQDGTYKINATLINSTTGCSVLLSDEVKIKGYDLPILENDTSFVTQSAQTPKITVDVVNGSGKYTYDWLPEDRFVNSHVANPELINYISGEKFSVYINDLLSGCSNTQEVMVVTTIDLNYLGTTLLDSVVCKSESAKIKVDTQFGDKNNIIYIWQDHNNVIPDTVTSPIFTPISTVSTVYELKEVSDGQTFFYPNKSFNVVVNPSGLGEISSDSYCEGGNSLVLKPVWMNNVQSWNWFDASSNRLSTADYLSVDIAQASTFYAVGNNEFGCVDSSMFVISYIEAPIAVDTTLYLDKSVIRDGDVDLRENFVVGGNDTYSETNYFVLSEVSQSVAQLYMFNDEDGTVEYTLSKANFGFVGPDHFKYRITNLYCPEVIAEATVTVMHTNKGDIFVPNGFSPNGDGYKDVLVFDGLAKYPAYKLMIYNRWGLKVYEATTPTNSWDGKANVSSLVTIGEDLPDGTYYYIIDIPGEKLSGFVEMLR